MPTLIQRIHRRREVSEHSKGVDRLFEFDYMGRSEFEWGAIPQALKAMRANKNQDWTIRSITAHGVTGYYVGSPETFNVAVQVFEDQLKPRSEQQMRPLEWTGMREAYFPEPRPEPKRKSKKPVYEPRRFDGWWVLDASMPFLIFKDKAHAEDWMGVF
jgi:hypothetical protein